LKYFAKYLLGLEPVGVGWRRFRFAVRPPSGVTTCEGALPTDLGVVRVNWRQIKAGLSKRSEIPRGIRLID
jgi:hypothetical protein